jgi:hypothetical protein
MNKMPKITKTINGKKEITESTSIKSSSVSSNSQYDEDLATKVTIESNLKNDRDYEILKECMKSIADVCDHAHTHDGQGFNGVDTNFGHILAKADFWSPKMANVAYKFAKKYRKQLLGFGIKFEDIQDPATYEPKTQSKKSNPFSEVGKKAGNKDGTPDKKPKKEFKGNLRQHIIDNVSISSVYPHSLRGNRGICAFKSSQKSPSFVLYGDSWSCWSCKHNNRQYTGGDVINLKANLDNISYSEALHILAKENGIQMSEQDKIIMDQRATVKEIHEYFAKLCEENLQNSKYFDFVKEKRGFPDEFMKKKRIGLVDRKIQRNMNDTYTKLELQWAGLLNDKGNWICGKRIVYPYFDISNHPNYFIYRLIDAEPDYSKDAKYMKMYVKGSPNSKNSLVENPLFGLETLNERDYNPDILIIGEGMTDALSCHLSGFACISPITTSFKEADEKRVIKYLQRYKNGKIVIINDTEKNNAGEIGGQKTLELLLKNNLPVYFGEIPNPDDLDKIDLDMCLQAETPEKRTENLQKLVDDAKEGMDYLVNQLNFKSYNDEDIENIIQLTFLIEKNGEVKPNITKKTRLKKKLKKIGLGSKEYSEFEKRVLENLKKKLGERAEVEEAEEDQKIINDIVEKKEVVLSEEAINLAQEYGKNNSIIFDMKKILDFWITGEDNNKILALIMAISSILDRPQQIFNKAQSSAGKSYMFNVILQKVIPEETVLTISGMSEKAMNYLQIDEDSPIKMMYLKEMDGSENSQQGFKMLNLEDGGISYLVTIKDPETNDYIAVEKHLPPLGLFITTAKENIDTEVMNRAWLIECDESPKQTKDILEDFCKRNTDLYFKQKEEGILKKIGVLQDYLRSIKNYDCFNPATYNLKDVLSVDIIRSRRDNPRLNLLCDNVALIHQMKRKTTKIDDLERILIYPEDIGIAIAIINDILHQTQSGLTTALKNILEAINKIPETPKYEKMDKEAGETGVTVDQINSIVKYSSINTLYKRITELEQIGYLKSYKNGRKKFILKTDKANESNLIDVNDILKKSQLDLLIFGKMFDVSLDSYAMNNYIHPLTGIKIQIREDDEWKNISIDNEINRIFKICKNFGKSQFSINDIDKKIDKNRYSYYFIEKTIEYLVKEKNLNQLNDNEFVSNNYKVDKDSPIYLQIKDLTREDPNEPLKFTDIHDPLSTKFKKGEIREFINNLVKHDLIEVRDKNDYYFKGTL